MGALMFIKRKGQRAGMSPTHEAQDVRYSHPSHEAFNERLKARQNPEPRPLDIDGPWMNKDALSRVPNVRREFDLNRDPLIRVQMQDEGKTEAQRRREQMGQMGRGSGMVGQDQPKHNLRPPPDIREDVDRDSFNDRWMAEQRDAVMARAVTAQGQPDVQRTREQSQNLSPKFPSR